MSKIFITRPIPDNGINMLKAKGYEVVVNTAAADRAATEEEMIAGVKGADALLPLLTDKVTAAVMDAGLPTPARQSGGGLKIIANYAVGFDNVDRAAARERKIVVTNTPEVLTTAVAEHTIALMLAIARRIPEADRFTRAGKYAGWASDLLVGTELAGKTLGIVGLGRIGAHVAHHVAKGFAMKIAYTDIRPSEEFEEEHGAVFYKTIDELLPMCDVVSLHVPLLDSTRHLINEARLALMKPTAYLINTARGPVVDEAALATALKEKKIAGAALDVFEDEPRIHPDLLKLENVVLTPHIASGTIEARTKMAEVAVTNIIECLEGRTPPNVVQ